MVGNDNLVKGDLLVDCNDPILVTGSGGFIGVKVVETLLTYGFRNLRCFVRTSGDLTALNRILRSGNATTDVQVIEGNLLSRDDCEKAAKGAYIIYHLAAGSDKSFAAAFMNSVITTRNLLDAVVREPCLKRFVNISSFCVYSNIRTKRGRLLDETCEVETRPERRGEAYCYGKVKQEELMLEYNRTYGVPYVILRPGSVFGPGKEAMTGRVGIGTFGIFLHLGGSNRIPFTYVDNCAEAIVLAGLKKGIDGEVFNIVDSQLPTSREFLRMYKRNVRSFRSVRIPKIASYFLCYLWEKYSERSKGQLAPVFNRRRWCSEWKRTTYSNAKLKKLLEWKPRVSFSEASKRYFEYCKEMDDKHA